MIDASMLSTETTATTIGQKRTAAATTNSNGNSFRAVKRRASKACQCCRARKVRCNVVEHGAPCTNCRLDEVECIITESKRRKKFWGAKVDPSQQNKGSIAAIQRSDSNGVGKASVGAQVIPASPRGDSPYSDQEMPHYLYNSLESTNYDTRKASCALSNVSVPSLTYSTSTASSYQYYEPRRVFELPKFIKPTPSRISVEDLEFLARKGALTIPDEPLRSELLRSHFEFVHPYMPLLDRKEFLDIVAGKAQSGRRIGLLLFQAVMFTGTAFADINVLKAAGYTSRKSARKAFFMKARLLYDFDLEQDRVTLVQALLLMTYWFETPDDQKDTWHWMGVAISLSHTIGLHRNPESSTALDTKRKKLWKRIWWSCLMRDRLVALGMRRPTRIKGEDCDVPMLTLDDFSIDMDIGRSNILYQREGHEEEMKRQRQLAIMCIEKAKLCACVSHVLTAQYSVLTTNQGAVSADGSTRTSMMLLPKGLDKDSCEVEKCDRELQEWYTKLPEEAVYRPMVLGERPVDHQITLHRNLLHMIYFTTVSALHRPQVLPSAPAPWPSRNANAALQEISRRKVRQAASEITQLARELTEANLVRYLPTTGVTVMLPAIIIHLLDIKSSSPYARERSLEGFSLCMEVMQGLRQSYTSADYASHFLEAAIKKADIQVIKSRKWVAENLTEGSPREPLRKRRRTLDTKDCTMSDSSNGGARNKGENLEMSSEEDDAALHYQGGNAFTPSPESIAIAIDENSDTAMIFQSPTSINEHDQEMIDDLGDDGKRGDDLHFEQNNESITISNDESTFSSALASISVSSGMEIGSQNSLLDDGNTLALKLESFLTTTPPAPSSTASLEDIQRDWDFDTNHLSDDHEHDSLFSTPSSPPSHASHINIPDDDMSEFFLHSKSSNNKSIKSNSSDKGDCSGNSNNDKYKNNVRTTTTSTPGILGKDVDPFLGHYEDGTEISFRNNNVTTVSNRGNASENNPGCFGYSSPGSGNIFGCSSANNNFVVTALESDAALLRTGRSSLFGNGNWMEGGADVENVGKLLDGVEFELEDVEIIQVLES